MSNLPNADRVLTAVAGLALFTLNEVRMFNWLPRMPDPGNGQTYAISIQIMDAAAPVYLSLVDLTVRWGLAALVVALCAWAVAETFGKQPQLAD
ncbi:MAG: hypothetical protein ABL932_10205 [Terricaulis sp.]